MESVSVAMFSLPAQRKESKIAIGSQLTRCSDGQRALDRRQLIGLNEARMRHIGNITSSRLEQPNSIFGLNKSTESGCLRLPSMILRY